MRRELTSGQVAQQAGVNVETLRYYERRQLLACPPRTQGGFRLYPVHVVGQVRFIKRAQSLGFSLEEIQELLRISLNGARCHDVKERMDRKLALIDQKILELQQMRDNLAHLSRTCDASETACPVLIRMELVAERPARSTL
jgi:MerR family mercuric resistance operon transcriptional regulator